MGIVNGGKHNVFLSGFQGGIANSSEVLMNAVENRVYCKNEWIYIVYVVWKHSLRVCRCPFDNQRFQYIFFSFLKMFAAYANFTTFPFNSFCSWKLNKPLLWSIDCANELWALDGVAFSKKFSTPRNEMALFFMEIRIYNNTVKWEWE